MAKILIFLYFLLVVKVYPIQTLYKQNSFFSSKNILLSCAGITTLYCLYKKYNTYVKNKTEFLTYKQSSLGTWIKIRLEDENQKDYKFIGHIVFDAKASTMYEIQVKGGKKKHSFYKTKLYEELFKRYNNCSSLLVHTNNQQEEELILKKILKTKNIAVVYKTPKNLIE